MYAMPNAQKNGLKIDIISFKFCIKNSILFINLKINAVIKIMGIKLK